MNLTKESRPREIRRWLEHGDNNRLAEATGYSAVYCSRVMGEHEPIGPKNIKIVEAALQLIASRKKGGEK